MRIRKVVKGENREQEKQKYAQKSRQANDERLENRTRPVSGYEYMTVRIVRTI